jgi:hypothetical protein
MNRALVIVAVAVIFVSCEAKIKVKSANVEGLWKLVSMKIRNTETGDWNDYRNGMQGYLLYDGARNMTIHLTDKGYEDTELEFPNFTDTLSIEALKYLTKSYYYIGEYEILNDSMVQHTRLSHSNPGDWGKVVKRHFKIRNDTLIMTPTEQRLANLELKWVKSE